MRKTAFLLLATFFVFLSFGEANAQKSFDKNGKIAADFEKRRKVIGNEYYFEVCNRALEPAQR